MNLTFIIWGFNLVRILGSLGLLASSANLSLAVGTKLMAGLAHLFFQEHVACVAP